MPQHKFWKGNPAIVKYCLSIGLTCLVMIAGSAISGNAESPDSAVYAFVGDKPVYCSEIDERINELAPSQRQQLRTQPDSLQVFIDNVLTDRMVNDAAAGLKLETTDTYSRKLRAASDKILRDLYVEMLINQIARPTEAELGVYYRLHLADFTRPPTIQLTYVLVGDVATANRVYREAKAGAAFDALQTTWSITTDSVTALQVDNIPVEMHAQLANLANDGIFMPYITAKGVYVFKKISLTPLQIMSLDEVRDAVRQAAHREKVQLFLAAFLETLKRDHAVRVVGSIQQNAAPQ